MSKTFKERPDKYKEYKKPKQKDKRFVSSKGRTKENIKRNVDAYIYDN